MKVLSRGAPPPPKPRRPAWWETVLHECKRCGTTYELDETDKPRSNELIEETVPDGEKTRFSTCPVCGEKVRTKKSSAKPLPIEEAPRVERAVDSHQDPADGDRSGDGAVEDPVAPKRAPKVRTQGRNLANKEA